MLLSWKRKRKQENSKQKKKKKNYQQYVKNDHQLTVFVQLHLIHKELFVVWKHDKTALPVGC